MDDWNLEEESAYELRLIRAEEKTEREELLGRVAFWQEREHDATLRLKSAKRNGEESRFWADARSEAKRKGFLAAEMLRGNMKPDLRRV